MSEFEEPIMTEEEIASPYTKETDLQSVECSSCGETVKVTTCTAAEITGNPAEDNQLVHDWAKCNACGHFELVR